MFLDGQKLHTYTPMAKARGFTGAVDKKGCSGNQEDNTKEADVVL